jgi:hypothetical protein
MIEQMSRTPAASPRFAVVMKSTHMPSSVISSGAYRKLAIVELAPGYIPSDVTMISPRCRAVQRVVEVHDRVHMGSTDRSYGYRLLRRLHQDAAELNASC